MMKKHLLSYLLLLCALIVGSGSVWAEDVTESETFSFSTSGCSGWSTDNAGSYCGGYGRNKSGSYYVANSSISNFSSVDFSSVTNPSVIIYVKALTNGGTNEYTVSLINSDGDVVGTPVTKTGGMGSGSNAASASESSVTLTPVSGATGYRIDFLAKSAITQTRYTLTYTTGGSGSSAAATTTTIDDSGITNTDVYTSTSAGSLSASVTVTESGAAVSGATVTWSGNNDDVATINSSTGEVTLVDAGTVTFTASYAGLSGTYLSSSNTYVMTVTSSAPYVQPTEFDINLNNTLFGTNYTGTVSNITDDNPISGSQDNVFVKYAGGGNHYVNNSQIRVYPNNKLTFEAPSGYNIQKIVITSSSTGCTLKVGNTTIDTSNKTWEGEAPSVVFEASGSSGNWTMTKVTVTLKAKSTDPAISAADVDITYDATSGSIDYTLENADGNVSATVTTGDWLTLGTITSTAVPFTCSANTGAERTATVTLSFSGADNKVVTVTQAAAPTPTINVTPTSLTGFTYEVDKGPSTTKTISVSGSNLTANISLSLDNNSDFEMSTTEGSGYSNSLTLTQSNGAVAAITVYVRLKAGLTIGDSYSGTITLTSTGATNATVSLSGSVTAPAVDYATLPFSYDGNGGGTSSVLGLTPTSLANYTTAPLIKFDATDDALVLKLNEAPGILSFDIKGMGTGTWSGTFDVLTSTDGVDYSNTLQKYTSLSTSAASREVFTLGSSVRYIKWVFTSKTSGFNVALGNIVVEKPTVTLNASGYATYTSNSAIDYSNDSEFSAWAITSISGTAITFSKVTSAVPAGTGVLLMGTAGLDVTPVTTTSGTALETNLLKGISIGTTIAADTYYGLSGKTFVPVNAGTVKAGKALLPVSAIPNTARALTFVFADETTGISTIESGRLLNDDAMYNLNGQRVVNPKKGLYIVNGKKIWKN